MSTNSTIQSYNAAIDNLPEDAFLGSLVFFSISRADVHLGNAHRDLAAAGLSTATLRKNLRPIDAFRKASADFRRKFTEDRATGIRSELMVRSVGEDEAQSYRHLIIERTQTGANGKRRKLAYDKVGEVTFTRGTKDRKSGEYTGHSVDSRRMDQGLSYPLNHEEDQWLTEKLVTFADKYDHLLNFMDSHAVRTFVREYIYDLGGICVKESGGLYFVAQQHVDELQRLADWVRSVGSEFHVVPLLNVADQKAMIMEAFEDEAVSEVERLMGEVSKILADPGRQIEEKTFDAYGMRAAELKKKVMDYNSMLGSRADRASTEINLYSQQMLQLANRIKKGPKA